MNFDMNSCWSRAVELVQSNFSLLVVIAGVFLLLPTVAIYLLVPDMQMLADPMADSAAVEARMGEILVPFMGAAFASMLFQFAGQGAMIALMGDARPTVGQALGEGLKIIPSMVAILLIFVVVATIGGILLTLPVTLLVGASGSAALSIIAIIPLLLLMVWLMARFSMTMPAMVLGGTLNPIAAISNSFRLTKPKQWAILGFWAMIYAVITVISLVFNGVIGVLAAMLGSGTTAMLIAGLSNGLVGMVTGMLICALAVAMYGQLTGPSTADIGETFD